LKYADTLYILLSIQDKIRKAKDLLLSKSLQDQHLQNEKAQTEERYKNNIKIYILISALAIVLVAAFMFYRNSRQKQKDAVKIQQAYDPKNQHGSTHPIGKMVSLGELTAGIAHEIQNH
jgi:ABC-type nickel/cobalt efflux system permease component RcnA